MRRRPLCFLCIVLVVLHYVLIVSGDFSKSPDIFMPLQSLCQDKVTVYGEVYQSEYKEGQQIIYLKQTVLSAQTHIEEGEYEPSYYKLKRIKITCLPDVIEYKIGDQVRGNGQLKEIAPATNPGQFDSQSYYAGKKVSYTMWEPKLTLIERPKLHLQRSLYELRHRCATIIKDCFFALCGYNMQSEQQRAAKSVLQFDKESIQKQKSQSKGSDLEELANVMQGIVLGEKGNISTDTTALYQMGGISHILAISAMHLTILGNGLYGILRRFGVSLHMAGVIAGVFLVLYGIFTGASIATLRALVMFLLGIGAQLTGRTYDGKTALSLAAVLLLSGNPLSLMDSGFLLSFTAMISFVLFREKRKLGSSILLYFFMAPVTLWFFYEIPIYSVFVNLLVVPTVSIVLISGVAVCALGSISTILGSIALVPGILLLSLYELLCKGITYFPYAKIVLGRPTFAGVIMYYSVMMIALWLFRKYRLSWKRFFVYLLMLPGVWILVYHPNEKLRITALDVGQGDCIVMELPGNHTYLVDGGSSSVSNIGEYRILTYLKYRGIRSLEAVFITHPDEDHISGIKQLLEMIKDKKTNLMIKELVVPAWEDMVPFETLIKLAKESGILVKTMEKGDHYKDREVGIECLHPGQMDYSDQMNAGSLVLQLTYRDFTALLTGDLEGVGEQELMETEKLCDIEYLKVAHHGSRNSTCEAFLEKTKPEISIISCGKNNFYGHPHKELLTRLDRISSDYYATKDCGAIWITTDGQTIDLSAFCKYN